MKKSSGRRKAVRSSEEKAAPPGLAASPTDRPAMNRGGIDLTAWAGGAFIAAALVAVVAASILM